MNGQFSIRWTDEARGHLHRLSWTPPRPRNQRGYPSGADIGRGIAGALWFLWVPPLYVLFLVGFAVYQAAALTVITVRAICGGGRG